MSVHDFKQMFFTAFRHSDIKSITTIYEMLVPLIIKHDEERRPGLTKTQMEDLLTTSQIGECECLVSIDYLSSFIDFFNYQPVLI